jgi:putative ABC transport system permease protein
VTGSTRWAPESQLPSPELTIVVRSAGTPAAVVPGVREAIRRLDADLPISNVRSLSDLVSGSTASRRFSTLLLSLFAAAAVALTLVGVYGVVSQLIAQSTREIGVRIAMGASGADVMSLVVTRALKIAIAGVVAGSMAAWLAAPTLGGMVYGIAPQRSCDACHRRFAAGSRRGAGRIRARSPHSPPRRDQLASDRVIAAGSIRPCRSRRR